MADIKDQNSMPNQAADNQELNHQEQYLVRINKLTPMAAAGLTPWPAFESAEHTTVQVMQEFQEDQPKPYQLTGRIVSLRLHGQTAFANLQDRTGKLQIYLRADILGVEQFAHLAQFLDLGDWVFVTGTSFKTKTGEITLKISALKIISKCLRPLPEKFHGLTDVEVRYRQRYLDLISNPESAQKFKQRSQIITLIRKFLIDREFIEVETPMLHPIPGGAAAKPFVTYHNALDAELYLRIAPELYLKRLIVGGLDRVFEINRNFRNEGLSTRHNPEFTMLEFYLAHHDYIYIMGFVEQLISSLARELYGTETVQFGDHQINLSAPFERISVRDSVLKYGGVTAAELTPENIDQTLQKYKIKDTPAESLSAKIYLLFETLVEHKLIQPTFIIDYPLEISPLAKASAQDPEIAARYELFIGGMEISNAFNELNDPLDQAARFKKQASEHASGNPEAHMYDADFILALEYGLPPTVGVGIGIDRLVMILTNTKSIRDVILFPTLKKK